MFKTVRSKFALGYLGLIVLIILLGLVSIFTMSNIQSTIEGLITTNYNSIDRLNKMKDAIWNSTHGGGGISQWRLRSGGHPV